VCRSILWKRSHIKDGPYSKRSVSGAVSALSSGSFAGTAGD
jgi:hypothetical protein